MEKPQVNPQEVINNLFNIIGRKQVQIEELQMIVMALKSELEKYTVKKEDK